MIAITRDVPSTIARGLRTHAGNVAIDLELARKQHEDYRHALETCGCDLIRLLADDDHPDSVFVEDSAVVLDGTAVIARSGAVARRREGKLLEPLLPENLEITSIEAPGTLDGGDVLVVGKQIFAGLSTRTNAEGIEQLSRIASRIGYRTSPVEVHGCLHLKSAASAIGEGKVLLNPELIDASSLGDIDRVLIPGNEAEGANVLLLGNRVICSVAFPATVGLLSDLGLTPIAVDNSEMRKAEAGVTCSSIIIDVPA